MKVSKITLSVEKDESGDFVAICGYANPDASSGVSNWRVKVNKTVAKDILVLFNKLLGTRLTWE